MTTPQIAMYALWIAWFVSWHVAMLWTSRTVKRDESPARPITLAAVSLGFAGMLGVYRVKGIGELFLWTAPAALAWIAVAGLALSFVFMWWARIHLGRLWSGSIVTREGHRVVDSGPYALVRHPIYTGIMLAAVCTLILKGTWPAVFGFVLLTGGFFFKARAEERFLRNEFGDQYDGYARRVPMLVPFAPKFS